MDSIKKIVCKIFGHKNETTVVGVTDKGEYFVKCDKCERCQENLQVAHPYSIQYRNKKS
jgi:rRNA maturation protein Nop10